MKLIHRVHQSFVLVVVLSMCESTTTTQSSQVPPDDAVPQASSEPQVAPPSQTDAEASTLPGVVTNAPVGRKGVDAFDSISASAAKAMVNDGYHFAARYIRHAGESHINHITVDEAHHILHAGLALSLVQIGRSWSDTLPTAELGTKDATFAVNEAAALGYPAGAIVFLDIEGIENPSVTSQHVIDYATAWHETLKNHFVPGYYVGPNGRLNADELGSLPFTHFWKSGTDVPSPTGRGYQITQHRYQDAQENEVSGVGIDYDVTQHDEQGDTIPWVAPIATSADGEAANPSQ